MLQKWEYVAHTNLSSKLEQVESQHTQGFNLKDLHDKMAGRQSINLPLQSLEELLFKWEADTTALPATAKKCKATGK